MEFILVVLFWIMICCFVSFMAVIGISAYESYRWHHLNAKYPYWLAKRKFG